MAAWVSLLGVFCWASITRSISGVVTDPSGAVISNFAGGHMLADTMLRHRNSYFDTRCSANQITESKNSSPVLKLSICSTMRQFFSPDGEIDSSNFGLVTCARDPRIIVMQIGVKFLS